MVVESGAVVNLSGKRILVTHSDRFMGPVLCETITQSGAELIASDDDLTDSADVSRLIEKAGQIDCLIANLAMPAPQTLATEVSDAEWSSVFKTMVDPLHWLVRAALPQMIDRGHGKILLARHNVQVNAIAQNFVDNETYFPKEVQQNPAFQKRLKSEVPLGRLVGKHEDAGFAAYLCSDAADCFVGQVFPVCGGWVAR